MKITSKKVKKIIDKLDIDISDMELTTSNIKNVVRNFPIDNYCTFNMFEKFERLKRENTTIKDIVFLKKDCKESSLKTLRREIPDKLIYNPKNVQSMFIEFEDGSTFHFYSDQKNKSVVFLDDEEHPDLLAEKIKKIKGSKILALTKTIAYHEDKSLKNYIFGIRTNTTTIFLRWIVIKNPKMEEVDEVYIDYNSDDIGYQLKTSWNCIFRF